MEQSFNNFVVKFVFFFWKFYHGHICHFGPAKPH